MYLIASEGEVLVHSPAKINLFLEVLGRRSDGFHEIETCMALISLMDTLHVRPSEDGRIHLRLEPNVMAQAGMDRSNFFGEIPQDQGNLVVRALERMRAIAGVEDGAVVTLRKRIPAAAGLGGASGNAAAAILAADRLWNLRWPLDRLIEFAATIGSDVAFFVTAVGAEQPICGAVCRGRGERVELLTGGAPLHVVIVKPPVGLATSEVYQHCRPANDPIDCAPLVRAWRSGDPVRLGKLLFNRLSEPARQLSPWIARVERTLARLDTLGVLMSGSGSSSFALARNSRHAQRLATVLRASGLGAAFAARTLSRASSQRSFSAGLSGPVEVVETV